MSGCVPRIDSSHIIFAGGKCGEFHEIGSSGGPYAISGDPTNETQHLYWIYANSDCADNYALWELTEDPACINGTYTSLACLESAKSLLRRFTFILDQACLNDSLIALGKVLQLNITQETFRQSSRLHHNHPVSIRERLNNDTLYEYLKQRFRRDIELYEWSKNRSIVQCGNLSYLP